MASEKTGEKSSWLDISPDQWMRGEALPDVEVKCMKLCANYLGGSWIQVTDHVQDLEVRRITGGLTNQLYYVGLRQHIPTEVDEPREVAIKFYQPKLAPPEDGHNERLSDVIIVLLASQLGIGPRIYGLFDEGMIQSYHQVKHQQNDYLLRSALHKLATLNLLQVPIIKQKCQFHLDCDKFIKLAYEELQVEDKIHEYNLETLAKHDIKLEFKWFRKMFARECPRTVFCHNDFRSSNILVTEDNLLLCDYEYGGYGARGHDLAILLLEWGSGTWSRDKFSQWKIPDQKVLEKIARIYLECCDKVQPGYTTQEGNTVEDLVRECKICCMENIMILTGFHINLRFSLVNGVDFDEQDNLELTETLYALYHRIKQQLLEENIVKLDYD